MLHGAKIDLQYWREAFIYAVYICSITPTSALKGKILYTKWYVQKPDMTYLWIFELLRWVHMLKEVQQGKLKSHAV